MRVEVIHGLCEEVLKGFDDNSFDSVVTDPPYGLKFMGKKWDYEVPTVAQWKEVFRVLKPGGYLLSFAGTRTQHRMACNIEDAGFEIRDMIAWVYGSGFPKSLNIGKAVDKLQGNEREEIGEKKLWGHNAGSGAASFSKNQYEGQTGITRIEPLTKGTSEFEGWGTALKPAIEPIGIYYKPLTISNIVSILCLEITNLLEDLICQRSNVNVSDVGMIFQSIQQSLEMVGVNSVAESAKTLDWENIESVILAAHNSIFQKQQLIAKGIIKENSVHENAKENGKNKIIQESIIPVGKAEDCHGVDIFILELMENISENTALSWKNILKEILNQMNTYTTLTAISKITELKILRLFLYQNISNDIGSLSFEPNLCPITVARKPVEKGLSVAENCLKWGTGGINIDGCRIEVDPDVDDMLREVKREKRVSETWENGSGFKNEKNSLTGVPVNGRFPANLIHDGSQEVLDLFPQSAGQMGDLRSGIKKNKYNCYGDFGQTTEILKRNDSGSAARFFYCAKSSRSDRNSGLDNTCTVKYNIPKIGGVLCKEENMVAAQLLQRVMLEQEHVNFNIDEYGENITAQCHKDFLSTILTEINRIIELKILNLLTPSLTKESIADVNCEMVNGGSLAENAESLKTWIMAITNGNQALALGASRVALQMLLVIKNGENWIQTTNTHSTVKPTNLMRYLCRLVTPPKGIILDPFCGSGSTGKAAILEGFNFVGIDREIESVRLAEARINVDPLFRKVDNA